MLRSLEKRQLEKVLKEYGIKHKNIELYCLVWQAFKELFEENYPSTSSDGRRSKNPPTTPLNNQQLSQIAARYNQLSQRLEIKSNPANVQEINKILATCVQAVRISKK